MPLKDKFDTSSYSPFNDTKIRQKAGMIAQREIFHF
jgi:hypothetical protein